MLMTLVVGCSATVPDRRADGEALASRIRTMAGVVSVTEDTANSPAQGLVYFRLYVDMADNVSGDQAAAVTARYLRNVATGRYSGYRLELDLRNGANVFAVDSGRLPITNSDQIVAQTRDWISLRREFPGATVTFRATIAHPDHQRPEEDGGSNAATLEFPDPSNYRTVAAAARTLADRFPQLTEVDWAIDSGKLQPAEIKTSRRLPTLAELAVWSQINVDQSIPHVDRLRINGPVTAPVWFSEKITNSRDVAVALELAQRHLPIVAALPGPILYTASDQLSGHIGGRGIARGPVAVTIGGCTRHDPLVYQPTAAERELMRAYESCASRS